MMEMLKLAAVTVVTVVVTVVLHELGHLAAAKALGYEAIIRLNSVSVVGGTHSVRDAIIIDAAGPLVTLVIAAIGLAMARRPGGLGATFVFAALMMRILATAVSIGNPNDEARISSVLGLGMWTLPALVVAILLWMMVLAARRSETGPKWFVVSWIGASIGFTGVVFGERFLPAIPV